MAGASVLTIESTPGNEIVSTFSTAGFISFVLWYTSYFYCLYKVYADDQTILRSLYDTKLKRYGDEVERVTSTVFMLYAIWKVPFDLSGSTEDMQVIVDIDKAIQDMGEHVDFSKNLHSVFIICIAQFLIAGTRIFSIWIPLRNLGTGMPVEKVFQMVYSDTVAFIITAQYCSYQLMLRNRYKMINKVLNSIKVRTCQEFFMFRLQRTEISDKGLKLRDKYVCQKIKDCGKVYSMLHKATDTVNDKFGLVLLLTVLTTLLFIILYLYYFMEATASGLFYDIQNYIDFLVYVFWQISFSLSIIYVCIYFSDATVREAQHTPQVTHEIINSNLDPSVTSEAVYLSLQILHQLPIFTANGLFKLDYFMLLEGARSVTTYLVILLQFVTDKHPR